MIDQEWVRRRAFQIWLAQGCPQGRDKEHWHQAEAELIASRHRHQCILDLSMAPKACALFDDEAMAEDL